MITHRKQDIDITKNFKRHQRNFKSKNKKQFTKKVKKFADIIVKGD